MAHYLDEPLVLVVVQLERLQALLAALARRDLTPLPDRLVWEFAEMQRRVATILREVRSNPDAVLKERSRDDYTRRHGRGSSSS
jgi:hypothetical protein